MTKELWINLPVKDINKSKEFFTKLGFKFHPMHESNPNMAGLLIGEKNIMVMLFAESMFKNFIQTDITDTSRSSEVLFSFDAESKEEVDDMAKKVEAAGGNIFAKPDGQNGMYGFAFSDPDGHRWNMLYMEPQQQS